jgi:uncharacterized membrane protein YdbT with pleckstrin-like domain
MEPPETASVISRTGFPTSTPDALPFGRLPASLGPERSLLTYYVLQSLLLGPFFLFALVPLYFRYRTMRYEVDEEGITMRWGVLFRREISLTYTRIQDIHLSSNVVERWLGLARIQIQTASGSATAEMTVEGLSNFEAVRDFFYTRMRGARDGSKAALRSAADTEAAGSMDELASTLRDVAAEVRAIRSILADGRGPDV